MREIKMYINGSWRESSNLETREIYNPATGEVIAQAVEGVVEDVNDAISSAKQAFESGIWSLTPPAERAAVLFKIAEKIEENADELAELETLDNGKPLREARYDVADAAACFRYYAGLITKPNGETYPVSDPVQGFVVREPVGVCGLIVPWNYPLLLSVWKLAPALAAGNSVVYKPSEVTPLTPSRLFKIFEEVGLPDGVANMVLGTGAVVGNAIVESKDVNLVSFTGGTKTGKMIMRKASDTLKKLSLELGGKSPNIVFADADFEAAVDYALFGIYAGAGQICAAGSRILVEEAVYDQFIDRFVERARKIKVGPGNQPDVEMGPLVSKEQLERVLSYIELGKKEGARLLCGGKKIDTDGLENGYFVEPTVFVDTTLDMRIVQEEIFGPVVVIEKFRDEKEAILLANGTDYGLAGAVFTSDGAKALRVVKQLRAGITWINTFHNTYNEAPWGGYKQSGFGRALGTYGLDTFQEIKQININLQVEKIGWFSN